MIINSHPLIIRANTNILRYLFYYIRLIILKSNILFSALTCKISNIKIIIVYIKNFLLYSEIVRYIDYETIT